MCFSGTEEPCAYAELISIGSIGGDKNKTVRACYGAVVGIAPLAGCPAPLVVCVQAMFSIQLYCART
jgi:hypothetical protein